MIELYHGSGSRSFSVLGQKLSDQEVRKLLANLQSILLAREEEVAVRYLNEINFSVHVGTNDFGDEFDLLFCRLPLYKYEKLREESQDAVVRAAFTRIAEIAGELGTYIRFIIADLDMSDPGKWDFFICHASEDKAEVVEPLGLELSKLGARVWYDKWTLQIGDSLSRRIDAGLADSKFGIVILSRHFFKKDWPQRELSGLIQKEIGRKKVILPVWHHVDREFISSKSLTLVDRVAGTTEQGIGPLARSLMDASHVQHEETPESLQPTISTKIAEVPIVEIQEIENRALNLRTKNTEDLTLLVIAAVPTDEPLPQDVGKSKLSLKSASVDYRGWPFLFYQESERWPPQFDEDSIWAVNTEPFFERPTFYYWRFKYTHSLFYSVQMTPESSVGLRSDLDAYTQAKLLAEAFVAIGRIYEGLGFTVDKPINILLKYMNLSEANITILNHSWLTQPYAGSQVVIHQTNYLNELLTRPWSLAAELFTEVGQRMGVNGTLPLSIMEALAKKHLSGGQKIHQ